MTPSPAAKSRPVYSFVIPIHNEREALPELHDRLIPVLAQLDGESEVILVDDGSTDTSWAIMLALRDADRRYRLVRLSRNFGHQAAITAGMDLAEGDAVVIMDADLQDPPEVVLEMAARWREGYEVIYGVRQDRAVDSVFKRATAISSTGSCRVLPRWTSPRTSVISGLSTGGRWKRFGPCGRAAALSVVCTPGWASGRSACHMPVRLGVRARPNTP